MIEANRETPEQLAGAAGGIEPNPSAQKRTREIDLMMSSDKQIEVVPAVLALADGTVFQGRSVGAAGETSGEVVFNTAMSGYQEILTDPSYVNQLLTFTCPHIGNVGVNEEDVESSKIQVSGIIIRSFSDTYSSHRATTSLSEYLKQNGIVGISDIDTRALVLHLRNHGSQMGIIATGKQKSAELIERAKALHSMEGLDLVKVVSTKDAYSWTQGAWKPVSGFQNFSAGELSNRPHVVALDCGIKFNILRLLTQQGFRVTVLPATAGAEEIQRLGADGVFISNGPGDPAAVDYTIKTVKELLGKKPIFGICLGHQILGHAAGVPTFKLKFGHRGGNHPVRNEITGKVEITVQNHGFASDPVKIPNHVRVSHLNLNDQTIEGFEIPDAGAFSVQYHPEASPGPHDAMYLFKKFHTLVTEGPNSITTRPNFNKTRAA